MKLRDWIHKRVRILPAGRRRGKPGHAMRGTLQGIDHKGRCTVQIDGHRGTELIDAAHVKPWKSGAARQREMREGQS